MSKYKSLIEFDYLLSARSRTAQFFHHSQPSATRDDEFVEIGRTCPVLALAFLNPRLQLLFMPLDKDKGARGGEKRRGSRGSRGISAPNLAGDIDSRRLDIRQKVRNSLPSLLTVVYRTQLAVARSTPFLGGKKGPSNRKECRVPGNRPNIFVYIETPRYKRRKTGIRVIPIFRDRCIYNRILRFLSSPLPSLFPVFTSCLFFAFHSRCCGSFLVLPVLEVILYIQRLRLYLELLRNFSHVFIYREAVS